MSGLNLQINGKYFKIMSGLYTVFFCLHFVVNCLDSASYYLCCHKIISLATCIHCLAIPGIYDNPDMHFMILLVLWKETQVSIFCP